MAITNASQKGKQISESRLPPKEAHLYALGDYAGVTVLHSQVLGMTYYDPEVTKGGIYKPQKTQDENNRIQGKIFLVIDAGPGAFIDDKIAQFHGKKIEKGMWFMARPSDGMEFFYNGNSMRLFEDVDIRLVIDDPEKFW